MNSRKKRQFKAGINKISKPSKCVRLKKLIGVGVAKDKKEISIFFQDKKGKVVELEVDSTQLQLLVLSIQKVLEGNTGLLKVENDFKNEVKKEEGL